MESPPKLGLGTINTVPSMEGLVYYQSMCLEFRYGDEKVLDTQPYLTHESASTHCVLRLNLIKGVLNTCIIESHTHTHTQTHTSIHLANNMASYHPKPQHTWYYIISKGERQTWQKSNKYIILSKAWHINLHIMFIKTHIIFIKTKHCIYKQMHVHVNVSLTLPHHSTYASMHGHVICMFMIKQKD